MYSVEKSLGFVFGKIYQTMSGLHEIKKYAR
jgi:hypothetical protein